VKPLRVASLALVVASVSVAYLVGCPSQDDGVTCKDACDSLATCGLLPSPLGAVTESSSALENCIARCENTHADTATMAILECTDTFKANVGDATKPVCDPECETLSRCIRTASPNEEVAGFATLRIVPQTAGSEPKLGGADTCKAINCTDAGACVHLGGGPFSGTTGGDWCKAAQASSGRAFIIQRGNYVFGELTSCEELLVTGAAFERIVPGPVRAGVELLGSNTDPTAEGDGGSQPFCRIFYGEEIGLRAGNATEVNVPLPDAGAPAVFTCEEGKACSDTLDNDDNGFFDCADPRCAARCDAGAPTADAGIDDASADSSTSIADAADSD
jgi:hypothetical protein